MIWIAEVAPVRVRALDEPPRSPSASKAMVELATVVSPLNVPPTLLTAVSPPPCSSRPPFTTPVVKVTVLAALDELTRMPSAKPEVMFAELLMATAPLPLWPAMPAPPVEKPVALIESVPVVMLTAPTPDVAPIMPLPPVKPLAPTVVIVTDPPADAAVRAAVVW